MKKLWTILTVVPVMMISGFYLACNNNTVSTNNGNNINNSNNTTPTAPVCGGIGRLDTATNLCWQSPRAPGGDNVNGIYSWDTAHTYCDNLSSGLFDNWRLPTAAEYAVVLGGCDGNVAGGETAACNAFYESDRYKALFGNETGIFMTDTPNGTYGFWFVNTELGFVDVSPDDPMTPDARSRYAWYHVHCVFQMY